MPWTNFGQECEVLAGRNLTIESYLLTYLLCFCFAPRAEINTISCTYLHIYIFIVYLVCKT